MINIKQLIGCDFMKKKMETSKKIALFSGICFAISLVYSMVIFSYSVICDKGCDLGFLLTLITVTGGAFATTAAFYYVKSKWENLFKIRRSFLKVKYLILKDIDLLDECRVQTELEDELAKIDTDIEEEMQNVKNESISNDISV